MNYSTSIKPLIVPKDCRAYAEQSLFNVLKCLSALNCQNNFLVCLHDVKEAIKFVMDIMPRELTETEMYKVNICNYDKDDDEPF